LYLNQSPTLELYICQNAWSRRAITKVILDFRIFLDHGVATIIRNEYQNKDVSLSLITEPGNQSNVEWESSCLICRYPLTRLKGPSIDCDIFLRMCSALPCDTRPMWRKAPLQIAKTCRILRISRRCMCGVRYDYIYRDSKIDNWRNMLSIWMRIFDFVVTANDSLQHKSLPQVP
jgi:hypothetical protein